MICVWLFLGVHVIRQRRGEREKPKEESHLPTSFGLTDVDSSLWVDQAS